MLAGLKEAGSQFSKGLRNSFTRAAAAGMAVLGMGMAAPANAQTVLSYAGDYNLPTMVSEFHGSFTVTPSIQTIVTELAPELSNPSYTFGTIVNPGSTFSFLSNAGLLSTEPVGFASNLQLFDVNQRSSATVSGDNFQLHVISDGVGLFPTAQILLGGYGTDSVAGGEPFYRFSPGYVKWNIPDGESITVSLSLSALFQENCIGTDSCIGSGGVLFGFGTRQQFNRNYMYLSADSRNGTNYSDVITKTYINSSGVGQTVYGQFNAESFAHVSLDALKNPGGGGIDTTIHQISAVPEPKNWALLLAGAALVFGAAFSSRNKKQASNPVLNPHLAA